MSLTKNQATSRMFVYLGVFIVGFLAVSLWSFWLVVRPPRIVIPLTPEHYHLPAEDVAITTADGLKLAAWFIPAKDARRPDAPAVILLHGYPAEKADMLSIAERLHPHVATLLLDLRYFGESEGSFTTLGLRERDDLKRAVDFLAGRGFSRIGVFGFSLGGATGIMAAADPAESGTRIAAVAAYAPFADLSLLGREAYARVWVLKYPLVELMRFWARLFFDGDITKPSPADAASRLSIPIFLVASREDEQIPFAHAEILREKLATNPRAEFYFLDRGRHGELPPDFEERLIDFFRRSFR